MQEGNNWGGDYSRYSFDERKQYFMVLQEQGLAVLDDEMNHAQEAMLTLLRRFIIDSAGNGSPNDGFKVVGTGAANDFTITGGDGTIAGAGHLYVDGLMVLMKSNSAYLTQPVTQSVLTTPGANRTDEVYIEVWLDEVGPADDPVIKDPTLNAETSRRLQLQWQVKVAEGSVTPAQFDLDGITHYTLHIATINRTAQAAIDSGMIVDAVPRFSTMSDHVSTADAHGDRAYADTLFASATTASLGALWWFRDSNTGVLRQGGTDSFISGNYHHVNFHVAFNNPPVSIQMTQVGSNNTFSAAKVDSASITATGFDYWSESAGSFNYTWEAIGA